MTHRTDVVAAPTAGRGPQVEASPQCGHSAGPGTMAAILQAIPTHQPGSLTYQAMTAVMYLAGLRPSEVVMLRRRALRLPDNGWGAIDVVEADVDWDEPGEPKTDLLPIDLRNNPVR